jgi:hypothetical protein
MALVLASLSDWFISLRMEMRQSLARTVNHE